MACKVKTTKNQKYNRLRRFKIKSTDLCQRRQCSSHKKIDIVRATAKLTTCSLSFTFFFQHLKKNQLSSKMILRIFSALLILFPGKTAAFLYYQTFQSQIKENLKARMQHFSTLILLFQYETLKWDH